MMDVENMRKTIGIIVFIIVVIIGVGGYFIISSSENDSILELSDDVIENNSFDNNIEEDNNSNNIGEEVVDVMRISVSDGDNNIIFELNDSSASLDLYNQLPIVTMVQDFSSNEKIFYPDELDIDDTGLSSGVMQVYLLIMLLGEM